MPKAKWSAPAGWRALAQQRLDDLEWEYQELARRIRTHKANVTKLLNGTGGKHIADQAAKILDIAPPYTAIESAEDSETYLALRDLSPQQKRAIAVFARDMNDASRSKRP